MGQRTVQENEPPGRAEVHPRSCGGREDLELEAIALRGDLDLLHRVHDEVRAAVLDLRPLVTRAHSDDRRARGNTRANTGGRVLKEDTARRMIPSLQGRTGRTPAYPS